MSLVQGPERAALVRNLAAAMVRVPLEWRRPQIVFINSMSDLFHRDVPQEFLERVFAVMKQAPQHCFQVLTKRADRLRQLAPSLTWPTNVWMGVSVENGDHRPDRRPAIYSGRGEVPVAGAAARSFAGLDRRSIDWVIVGGESGPRARPMDADWARDLRDQCVAARVPFFFKQWGGIWKKRTGRTLDGRTWDEMPANTISAAMTR